MDKCWRLAAMLALCAALNSIASSQALAQAANDVLLTRNGQVLTGKMEFRQFCVQCHGLTGVGNGPTARILLKKPTNLTLLSKTNGGIFPEQEVHDYIIGTKSVLSHGTPEMPLWGLYFAYPPEQKGRLVHHASPEEVRTRIKLLVDYVRSIQVE